MQLKIKRTVVFPIVMIGILLSVCLLFSQTAYAGTSFDKAKAKKKITVTYQKIDSGILVIYKNKNSFPVKLTGKVRFMDAEKKNISEEKIVNSCLGAKKTCALFFAAPRDSSGDFINYKDYKENFSVAKTSYKDYTKNIHISSSFTGAGCDIEATNQKTKNLSAANATFVFYDENKKIIGCRNRHLNSLEAGAKDSFFLDFATYPVKPVSVKVYLNWAY